LAAIKRPMQRPLGQGDFDTWAGRRSHAPQCRSQRPCSGTQQRLPEKRPACCIDHVNPPFLHIRRISPLPGRTDLRPYGSQQNCPAKSAANQGLLSYGQGGSILHMWFHLNVPVSRRGSRAVPRAGLESLFLRANDGAGFESGAGFMLEWRA